MMIALAEIPTGNQCLPTTSGEAEAGAAGTSRPVDDEEAAWGNVLKDPTEEATSQDEEETARDEMRAYLAEKRLDIKTDALDYWKVVGSAKFPLLAKLVRKYHSAPAGSAASERMFSAGRNVLGTKRLCLTPENTEALLYLKYNLRAVSHTPILQPVPSTFTAPNSKEIPTSPQDQDNGEESEYEASDIEIDSDADVDIRGD